MIRRINIVALLLFCSLALMADPQLNIPCIISFEDNEDLSEWKFNEGSEQSVDQWIVGRATHIDGKKSLYISCTPDSAAAFSNKPNVSVAYRKIRFPEATTLKHYDLSFDYRCVGDTSGAKLYVAIYREADFKNFMYGTSTAQAAPSSTSGYITPANLNSFEKLGKNGVTFLNLQPEWTNISLTGDISVGSVNSKKDYYLLFIWQNLVTDTTRVGTGACIDNIQFSNAQVKKPENLTVEAVCEDSALLVSWESALTNFAVEYRNITSQTWRRLDNIGEGIDGYTSYGNKQSFQINQLPEATYDVRVRGINNEDTSAYVVSNRYLLYCPENHCVDYMNLNGPNTTCYYGHVGSGGTGGDPKEMTGVVDRGPDAKESRHTVHVDPEETDPRTDNELHTVPDGYLGSVRLGNWEVGFEAEAIEYTMVVDSATQGILIMKYAVVLNRPGPTCGDPGFSLRVLDSNGALIDLCGEANFTYSSAKADGWRETLDGKIVWKDWTAVGLDLTSYNNQTIIIQLITRDCGGGGHFGYAYFAMDCVSATIETENCGDDEVITVNAPDGFAYTWLDENGNEIPGQHDKTLEVPPGEQVYTCHVSYLEQPSCGFDLTTSAAPRYPTPEYTPVWQPKECHNYVKLNNTSYVRTRYMGNTVRTDLACDDHFWHVKSLTTGDERDYFNKSPIYTANSNGDTLEVTLTAYIGVDHACDETLVDTVVIPSIITPDSVIRKEFCEGNTFFFAGDYRTKDSTYVDMQNNFAGCDSITTLYLTVHPNTPDQYLKDTTCSNVLYTFNGIRCDTAGRYMSWLHNQWGCDSVVYMDLTILDNLELNYDTASFVCADNAWLNLQFYVQKGDYDSITIHFGPEAKAQNFRDTTFVMSDSRGVLSCPFPANDVKAGYYSLDMEYFQHHACGSHIYRHNFQVRYSNTIIKQKWNDVLGVLNSSKNGGYEFVGYQWYKDGDPIPGATEPFYYGALDNNSKYSVELTRSDGVKLLTCDMQPTTHTDKLQFPTLVKTGIRVQVRLTQNADITIFTINGQMCSSQHVEDGGMVEMPAVPGSYVVMFKYADGTVENSHLIVTQ